MHCPQRVSNVVTDIKDAHVEVSWDAQSDIDSYEILFKQSDSSWDKITGCDNEDGSNVNAAGRPYCSLENSLIKDQTGLANQALIVVKIRAKNINCTGPWSIENTGNAEVAACPSKMSPIFNID